MPETTTTTTNHEYEKLHSDEKCLQSLAACRVAAPLTAGQLRSEHLRHCFVLFDQCRAHLKIHLSIVK